MKKIILLITSLGFAAVAQSCNQTVSSAKSGDPAVTDGVLREISASSYTATITAANDFSIHLEGVSVASGQNLEIIAKASAVSEVAGWKFAFTGGTSGKVRVSRLGSSQAMDSGTYDTSDGKTWCIDVHATENPNHHIIWKGTCSNSIVAGQWGNAQFNSNEQNDSAGNHDARSASNYGTGMTACGGTGTCFTNTGDPTGTKVLYKADKGTVSGVVVKAARTSGL